MNPPENPTGANKHGRMLTFRGGGWVVLLAVILPVVLVAVMLIANRETLTQKAVGDGRNIDSYGFDLSTCLVPRELIAAAGPDLRKDGLPTPTNPATIPLSEFDPSKRLAGVQKLLSHDRVVGVEINGQARAYPLWVMAWHEIINDELGGTPIAVTFSPLCDSVVVFNRNVDGETLEFGVSGLLYNSNLLMFDRRPDAIGESLWSQLQFRAVAGPAAQEARTLSIMKAALVPWSVWRDDHPETSILLPDPTRKRLYKRDAYQVYLESDRLHYPVAPLPPADSWALKTRILAVKTDNSWSAFALQPSVSGHGPGDRTSVYALWFAWYAMHPDAIAAP